MGSNNSSPKSVLDLLKDWKELITFVALTLTSGLSGIFGGEHPTLQKVSWVLAVVFVAVGAYVIHRKQKRKLEQERREKIWAESEAQRKAGSAFRSLAPFEERDKLPGKDRKVEARAIATRIASDDFRFGVVCGDTGCGKTSMLRSEVTRALQDSGLEVAYVRNPRRLENRTSEALPPMERLASELKALAKIYIRPTADIVILDQFEEWFIEYPEPEHRVQIGKFIRKLAERSRRLRIVCAIRREFLIDFHDLSDELPQQLSTANLFHLKNFTVDQAKDVIIECANADGLVPDEPFAEMVAQDLAEGSQVRPPELQIVCTYLAVSGGLNTPKYRQAGGTAGILAHHIQEALDASKDRAVAARILRALCDFPAHAKQKAKTLDELTEEANRGNSSFKYLKASVEELIHHFVLGRILAEEKRPDGAAFALMHDYLVDAVQLATSDASTKTDEANQLLRYYVSEQRGTIPWGKLRFIRRFAEPRYSNQLAARRLIRKSIAAPILRWGTPVAVAIVLVGLTIRVTTETHWVRGEKPLGIHTRDVGDSANLEVNEPVKGKVSTKSTSYLRLWDARTGDVSATIKDPLGAGPDWSPSGKFLTLQGLKVQQKKLIDLTTGAETRLPDSALILGFEGVDEWLRWLELDLRTETRKGDKDPFDEARASIYSIPERRVLYSYDHTQWIELFASQDRFILHRQRKPEPRVAELYELSTGKLLGTFSSISEYYPAVSVGKSTIAGVSNPAANRWLLSVWSIDGGLIGQKALSIEPRGRGAWVEFLLDGSLLLIYEIVDRPDDAPKDSDREHVVAVVRNVPPFEPVRNIDPGQISLTRRGTERVAFMRSPQGTEILDKSSKNPRVIKDLHVGVEDRLILSRDGNRAIVWRKDRVEQWDLTNGKLITLISVDQIVSAKFTVDDTAVMVRQEGDVFSLFDAVDGTEIVTRFPTGGAAAVYYDRDCRRFNVWTESGEVVRYTEETSYLGRFRTRRCS